VDSAAWAASSDSNGHSQGGGGHAVDLHATLSGLPLALAHEPGFRDGPEAASDALANLGLSAHVSKRRGSARGRGSSASKRLSGRHAGVDPADAPSDSAEDRKENHLPLPTKPGHSPAPSPRAAESLVSFQEALKSFNRSRMRHVSRKSMLPQDLAASLEPPAPPAFLGAGSITGSDAGGSHADGSDGEAATEDDVVTALSRAMAKRRQAMGGGGGSASPDQSPAASPVHPRGVAARRSDWD